MPRETENKTNVNNSNTSQNQTTNPLIELCLNIKETVNKVHIKNREKVRNNREENGSKGYG